MPKQLRVKNRNVRSRSKSTGLLPKVRSWHKTHIKIALVVFMCTAVAGIVYWRADSQAAPTAQTAKQADVFVDTIGINTHLHYGSYSNYAELKKALLELGIRHIRDYPVPSSAAKVNELNANGIKLTAIMGSHKATGGDYYIDNVYSMVRNSVRDAVVMVEGSNEPDNTSSSGWEVSVRAHQQKLWNKMKGDPITSSIPVAAPSMTWDYNTPKLGDLSSMADFANMHSYPGGRSEQYRVSEDIAAAQKYTVPGKPVYNTETGYHNQVPSDTGHDGSSETADAIYMPRLYLHYFNLGVPRTFDYELYDQGTSGAEDRFGWLRRDFSRKPVFHAVKNLITLLEDPGSSFSPGALSYELTGTDSTTQKTLLQKRDGSFWLAVWQQTSVANPDTSPVLNPPNRTLTLNLANTASAIRTYMPNRGTSVINSASNTKTFSFESSEEVTLIQIGGVAVSPPPIDPNPPTPPPTTTAPDLVITSLTPTTATAGQPISFQATIKNQGTAATPAGTIHGVAFRVDGTLVNWNDVHTTSLAPGASVTLTATGGPSSTATWTPPATGTVTVEAYVDDINRIPGELDETNNKLTTTVTVTATTTTKPGDANGDGVVNAFDLSIVLSNFGTTGKTRALGNVDGDAQGNVNGLDLSLILTNYGK